MQEDFYPAAEKILTDVHHIFIRDPKLKSFEIIPTVQSQNKSPIHLEDHCLGLESWCVPHLYYFAHNNLMKMRESKRKFKEIDKCSSLLLGALLLNPDMTTWWNMRKDLLVSGKLDPLFELHFTSVVLTFKPKCAEIFSFRKWVLKRLLHDGPAATSLLQREIEVCEVAADRYSNNYHAWTHRIWCLSQSTSALLEEEWAASFRWVQRHVSDYSGYHYRQRLINSLLTLIQSPSFNPNLISLIIFSVDEATEAFVQNVKNLELTMQTIPLILKIFIYELSLNSDLIWNFMGHEALWCHRRFIFYEIKKFLFNSPSNNISWGYFETTNHSTSEGVPNEKTLKMCIGNVGDQFTLLLSLYEDVFLRKCSDESGPQQEYANKHKNWLSKISKFQLPYNNDNCDSYITFKCF